MLSVKTLFFIFPHTMYYVHFLQVLKKYSLTFYHFSFQNEQQQPQHLEDLIPVAYDVPKIRDSLSTIGNDTKKKSKAIAHQQMLHFQTKIVCIIREKMM